MSNKIIENKCTGATLIEWQELKDLQPHNLKIPYHTEKIKKSIIELGFANPFDVWVDPKTNETFICDGHGRNDILKELIAEGYKIPKELPCTFLDNTKIKTRKEAIKYLLRVFNTKTNPINSEILNEWNKVEHLELEHAELEHLNIDHIKEDEKEKQEMRNKEDNIANLTEEKAKYIQFGDIIELQGHRLMCGDSFDVNCINKLLDGVQIDAIFTDPPYGMNLNTDFSKIKGISKHPSVAISKSYKTIEGDNKPFDPGFILQHFKNIDEIFLWGANYYAEKLPNLAMSQSSWIVWDKRVEMDNDNKIKEAITVNFNLSEFELCWSKKKHKQKIARFLWFGMKGLQSEGEETTAHAGHLKRVHPNQKPVRMINWFFNEYLQKQKNILDLFGGSGSTLLACHQSQKNCFMMEYDPQYVEIIIARFIKLYGDKEIIMIRNNQRISYNEIIK
jgi:DNA modification methylase